MTTIRPALSALAILGVIGLIICLPGFWALLLGQGQGALFILVGSAISIWPASRYYVRWDSEALEYRGLITTRKIRFSEIKDFDFRGPELKNRFGPTVGLYIYSALSDAPTMAINIKPFSRRDIARLVQKLKEEREG